MIFELLSAKFGNTSGVLMELTTKAADKHFPKWENRHQLAFESIKAIVTLHECLTVIDQHNIGNNEIFVTANASNKVSGAVLSFGPSWETAHLVAYDSMTFKGPELNIWCMRKSYWQ